MLKAILFDLGGTLAEYEPMAFEEMNAVGMSGVYGWLKERGLVQREFDHFLRNFSYGLVREEIDRAWAENREVPFPEIIGRALVQMGIALGDAELLELERLYYRPWAENVIPYSDTVETLSAVRKTGLKMALVSNVVFSENVMMEDLRRIGVEKFFDAIVFSSQLGHRKPDARIYRAVLDPLGVDPGAAMFVGDRLLEDVQGPQSLGIKAIWKPKTDPAGASPGVSSPGTPQAPYAVVRHLSEILPLIEDLRKG